MAQYDEVISALPYFGNIEFYSHLVQNDLLVDIHENYVKQSLRNRCELTGSQGRFNLTVPVHRPSGIKTPFESIIISYTEDWQHQHLHALRSNYGSSPFFIHYWEEISSIWSMKPDRLVDLNDRAHRVIAEILDINKSLSYSESYVSSTPGIDLRPRCKYSDWQNEEYIQVFSDRTEFIYNLSILDAIFCLGPEVPDYLRRQVLV
ncbi:MAG: hypothetical protein HKN45_09570 [Flavobacteriales bacterium]|nr:hypothetical protein [Flavobacteriales bacterium]